MLLTGLITSFVVPAAAWAGGSLKAVVKLEGKRPQRTVVKMDADPICKEHYKKDGGQYRKVGSENAIVGKTGEVRYAVVYVKDGLGDATYEPPTEPALLDQRGCMYVPHVLTVQVGQPVTIRNSDPTLHNIHSFAEKQKSFNIAQARKGMEETVRFTRPEFVKIKCDVHAWMRCYVGVFTHPFHAVTDKQGTCEIKDLPAGEYTFAVWHEELGETEQKVTIADGKAAEVTFTLTK
jgi:plastocyanin